MVLNSNQRTVLESILSGVYTPYDVREFVRLCYTLALPLIRKKVTQGRINLESLGLNLNDVVYDCIADLFVRDSSGRFTEVTRFFGKEIKDVRQSSDALLLATLRRILFGSVNVNLIRIHSGADPIFGKVLHNLEIALTRSRLFEKYVRLGETMLVCCDAESLLHLPDPPMEYLRHQLSNVVLIHDSMPTMLMKLAAVLRNQEEFQRTVPLMGAASLLKEVYALGAESETESDEISLKGLEELDTGRLLQTVGENLRLEMVPHYVGTGKMTMQKFEGYLSATTDILSDLVLLGRQECRPYSEYLSHHLREVTQEEYVHRHKSTLEHFIRVAKRELHKEMKREETAL